MSSCADIFSAARSTVEDVKYFIEEERVDVNTRTNGEPPLVNGRTALHIASYDGKDEIAKYLISKGADVNAKNDIGWTPLHQAAADTGHAEHDAGKLEVAKILISNGANVNATDSRGLTPLNWAKTGRTRTEMQEYIKSAGGSSEVKISSEVTLGSVGKFLLNIWYLVLGVLFLIIFKDPAMAVILTIVFAIAHVIIKFIIKLIMKIVN